jgi:hypothetical protein
MSAKHTGVSSSKVDREFLFGLPDAFAMRPSPSDNLSVQSDSPSVSQAAPPRTRELFASGALVIATLCNPREKFWGMILALAPEGLSLSGAELASFEDLTVMVRDGEPFTPAVVFFPMHRIERVELDLPDGSLPSLSQRFFAKTGLEPSVALAPHADPINSTSRASKERA